MISRGSLEERRPIMQDFVNMLNKIIDIKKAPITKDAMPPHPSWDNNMDFEIEVCDRILRIVKLDANLGLKGAIRKAETYLEAMRDTHDRKMVQVYERVVYKLKSTSAYIVSRLSN